MHLVHNFVILRKYVLSDLGKCWNSVLGCQGRAFKPKKLDATIHEQKL